MNCLVVDYGTSSCRVSLVDSNRGIVATCRQKSTLVKHGDVAEVEPEKAWTTVVSAIRRLLDEHPQREIAAVGISAMLGWVFLDCCGKPLGNSPIWMDSRKSAWIEAALQRNQIPVYRKTGRRFSPELLIAKWTWLKENQPELASRTATVISLKDELVRRLTGEVLTDTAHLNYTQFWNIKNNQADDDILGLVAFPRSLLPEARYPFDGAGVVSKAAASATGLVQGTPVVTGSIDGTTAMYGGGMAQPGKAVLVSGTTDVLMTLTETYLPDGPNDHGVLTINNGMVPGTFAVGGATGTSGGALDRICALLGGDQAAQMEQAAAIPPGSEGLLFIPGLSGERAPYWNADISGGLIGLRLDHGPAHIVRAVMEGAALRLKRIAEEMFCAGRIADTIHVVGGGSMADVWNRIKADALGIPLCRLKEIEATTIGSAMFCDLLVGDSTDLVDAGKRWIRPAGDYPVDRFNADAYNELFEIFEGFILDNTHNFAALSGFGRKIK